MNKYQRKKICIAKKNKFLILFITNTNGSIRLFENIFNSLSKFIWIENKKNN